jgi:hypothetical protein
LGFAHRLVPGPETAQFFLDAANPLAPEPLIGEQVRHLSDGRLASACQERQAGGAQHVVGARSAEPLEDALEDAHDVVGDKVALGAGQDCANCAKRP